MADLCRAGLAGGVDRNDFDDRVQFDVDNLPHGVIVDNIGLNGLTLAEYEMQILSQ